MRIAIYGTGGVGGYFGTRLAHALYDVEPSYPWVLGSLLVGSIPGIIVGSISLRDNVKSGNYGGAAVDAAGLIADGIAAALPGIPGGAGLAIAASRKLSSEAAEASIKAGLTAEQVANLARFESKLPANATSMIPTPASRYACTWPTIVFGVP